MPSPPADSLADYLPAVAARTPPALISGLTFTQLAAVAHHLPGSLAHTFGFECVLAEPAPCADLLIGARGDRGRRALAARYPVEGTDPAARGIGRLVRAWNDPTSTLHHTVDNAWLEFDINGPDPSKPSVFFGFQPPPPPHQPQPPEAPHPPGQEPPARAEPPADPEPPGDDVERQLDVTWTALGHLLDDHRPAPLLTALRMCFRALTAAQVFQVGLMLARTTNAVRLCLRMRTPDDVTTYLTRIDWPGDTDALSTRLEPVLRHADYVCLDVDVTPSAVASKIGVECYLLDRTRWPTLLDTLVRRNLCTPLKRDALITYPGQDHAADLPKLWPTALTRTAGLFENRSSSTCHRSLHHVKVVHHDGLVTAKAYLAAGYRW